ncbi:hypothetical protein FQN57_003967 [Myotisia sp. PD_48]|nr:hypothetical protein FQN57_003967 [Myotisia sp. PD_48]
MDDTLRGGIYRTKNSTQLAIHGGEPPRKKMRKGTKSCVECRQRKIRCQPSESGPCKDCYRRGSDCVGQESTRLRPNATRSGTEPSSSLSQRIVMLEDTIGKMMARLDAAKEGFVGGHLATPPSLSPDSNIRNPTSIDCQPVSAPTPPDSVESVATGQTEGAPLLTLFDNHIIARDMERPDFAGISSANHLAIKAEKVAAKLTALLPTPSALQKLFDARPLWWQVWQVKFPGLIVSPLPPDRDVTDIAILLFSIICFLCQLPTSVDRRNLDLPFPVNEYVERSLCAIETDIINDDDFASSVGGMECMHIAAYYYANIGSARKGWLMFRRGIQFAQLSGFHLPTNCPSPDDAIGIRRLHTWCTLACGDRYLSLMLGLPYAVPDHSLEPHVKHLRKVSNIDIDENHVMELCLSIGQIIDRNQNKNNMSLPATLKIDQELELMAKQMGKSWWDYGHEQGDLNSYRTVAQFMHHFTRMLLHLPFMLRSKTDRRYGYSHNSAVESARSAIKCFKLISEDLVCKMVDFQVFTASVLLMIHLLDSPEAEDQQTCADWRLAKEIGATLRRLSEESERPIASQSAHIIEKLSCGRDSHGNLTPSRCDISDQGCRIIIPFFGAVRIVPGKRFAGYCHSQQPTPPLSIIHDFNGSSNSDRTTQSPATERLAPANEIYYQPPVLPEVDANQHLNYPDSGFDVNLNPNFLGYSEEAGFGPNLNLDLFLNQGLDFDWLDSNFPIS